MAVLPLYIPYTVFMVALLLYFVRYVNGYMKSFPDIQATLECGFTLKRVRDMTRTFSQASKVLTTLKIKSLKFSVVSWFSIILYGIKRKRLKSTESLLNK